MRGLKKGALLTMCAAMAVTGVFSSRVMAAGLGGSSSIGSGTGSSSVSNNSGTSTSTDSSSKTTDTTPSSTSSYVVVGMDWTTPTATYGQPVIVALPIVNMAKSDMRDIVITPIMSAKTDEFPFEIDLTGYTLKQDIIKGENYSTDIKDRTKTLFWTFRARDDIKNGYYKVDYNIQYTNDACEQEHVTISTYVLGVGKPGAGSVNGEDDKDGKISTPRLIVTGFETNPAEIFAGDTFTLSMHMKNTSQKTTVSNIEFDMEAAVEGKDQETTYYAFLPTSGSSTVYVNSLSPGKTTDINIEMSARADLAQKPYVLNVKMVYEDEKYNPFEGTASVSIPVKQKMKFETSIPEVMPESIEVGSESNVMFSIYNTGKTKLYNVQAKFAAASISGGDAFVGNLDSGATGNVDVMLTGVAPTADDGSVKIQVSYEDETGKVFTEEKQMSLFVTEPMIDMGMDGGMTPPEDEAGNSIPVWLIASITGGIIAVIAAIAVIVTLRKKKKKAAELAFLNDDMDDGE